jgi:DNA-binding ferritin-like protein
MSTLTMQKPAQTALDVPGISRLLGDMFSFNSCLKLVHWDVSGKGSYAAHISLDQAIDTLLDVTDRLVETSYASYGELKIVIPETRKPEDYVAHIEGFYDHIEESRSLFVDTFTQSVIDDYQEGIKQLLFRLKRLQ